MSLMNTCGCIAMENLHWLNCVLRASNNTTSRLSNVLLPKCHCIQIFLFCETHLSLKEFLSRQKRVVGGKQKFGKEHLNGTQLPKRSENLVVLLPSCPLASDKGSLLLVLKLEKNASFSAQ